MIPRSYLFVPGNRPDRFEKARLSSVGAAILDLEDAVAPEFKSQAREAVAAWIAPERPVFVRVNGAETPWFQEDLAILSRRGIAGVFIPKVESPAQIAMIAAAYPGNGPLLPMIESAQGLWNAHAIAKAPRVQRLVFGSYDYQQDLGIEGQGEELDHARAQIVFISRVAGISSPVEGVTAELTDMSVVQQAVAHARRLGFRAKLCIHPNQIAMVNQGFAPTASEIAWAQQILAAVEEQGSGAMRIGNMMVDRPIIERARSILAEK